MTVILGPAGAGLTGMQLAGAASLATTGTVATVNNKGNLGAGLGAVVSKDGLTNAAIATITAGVAEHYLGDMTLTKQVNGKTVIDLSSAEAVSRFGGQQAINNASAAAIAKAFGRDVTLAGILQSTIYNTLAAYSFDQVGNLGLKTGSPEKIALHALVGGMIAEASGSDFTVGAMAAGVNEAFANQLRRMATDINPERRDQLMQLSSQLLGVVAAAAVAGDDAGSLQAGAWVAGNATQYNNLNHSDMRDFVGDMNHCGMDEGCQQKQWIGGQYQGISDEISEWSKDAVSGAFAKSLLNQIQGGLTALQSLNCTTVTCTQYKDMLTERAMRDLTSLAEVTGQWETATSVAALVLPTSGSFGAVGGARTQAAVERFMERKAVLTGANVKNSGSSSAVAGEAGVTYTPSANGPKEAGKAVSPIVPGGELAAHEAAGGHLLAKHVGQSEAQLLSRLSAEPKITGSSSFYDRTVAEKAVSQTLDMKRTEIANWLSGSANRLRLDHTLSNPVGISVARGASGAVDANSVRVILVRDSKIPTGYKILTGFPTVP